MSAETPKPQSGDRVRVSYEGTYEATAHGPLLLTDGSPKRSIFDDAAVEVLERADDPSKDLAGTVRRLHDSEPKHAVKHGTALADKPRTADAWTVVETGEVISNGDALHGDVIGAVPGTPAAEAHPLPPAALERVKELLRNGQQIRAVKAIREMCYGMGFKEALAFAESLPEWNAAEQAATARPSVRVPNEPHGLRVEDRRRIAEYVTSGELERAVTAAFNAGLPTREAAREYVEDMPEWQTYLNRHSGGARETCTREDCPGGTRCSSGAVVWHDRTPECGEVSS